MQALKEISTDSEGQLKTAYLNKSSLEIGKKIPILGYLSEIVSIEEDYSLIKINKNITARININSQEKLDLLKQYAFEKAVFVSTVLSTSPEVYVECETVIFGKKQANTI